MKHLLRTLSFLLAALLLLSAVAACTPNNQNPEETNMTDPAEETKIEETETDVPVGPADKSLLLCGEGLDAQIVLPAAPALWETAAAEALQSKLAGLTGITLPVVRGGDETACEILIGPADRDAAKAVDESALGTDGYTVAAAGSKLVLYAASADGMTAALSALASALLQTDAGIAVPGDLSETVKKDAESTVTKQLSGTWGDTVVYANDIANELNGAYTDGSRSVYDIRNSTMELIYDLQGKGTKQVAGFYNTKGIPYFTDSMDVFLTTDGGLECWSNHSQTAARVNNFRLGYYYRDIHVLDQNFTEGEVQFDPDSAANLLNKRTRWNPYLVSDPEIDKETYGITFTVVDSYDPYLSFNTSVDTKKYNALRVVMRTEKASSAGIYINNGSGFNSSQQVNFQVTPGEDFHEYVIMLNTMENYTKGKITAIRFDVGSFDGEKIEIAEVWAVSVGSEVPQINLDRTFHAYADKLHEELHFVAVGEVDDLNSYGMQTAPDASRVKGVCVIDAKGSHDKLTDVDWSTAEAAAFDIERAGVIGWMLSCGAAEKLTVREENGQYLIRIEHFEADGTAYEHGNQFRMGYRVYNDETHNFDGFAAEAYIERHPVKMSVTEAEDNARAIGYDPLRGCYVYNVNGVSFTPAYQNPQKQYKVNAELQNDGHDRRLYVMTEENVGCLENAVLLDESGVLLPISPEVCKNFCGENEEPLYDAGDRAYGESFFPMILKAGETRDFTIIHLYQNWGIFPLKQLSSIQFVAPYYHLSCGVTETNCIAPYYVYGKDYWTLPDFRAMSAPLWSSQPQHTSIGRLYWLEYTNSEGKWYGSDFVEDTIGSSGPVYADLWSDYLSDDGKIAVSYRHLETPQTDENRTYYEVDLTVLEDLSITDFKNDFSFFSFDGRSVAFSKMGYVNESGEEVTADVDQNDHNQIIKLGSDSPYFDYWKGDAGDYVCFALLVKNAEIVIGGEKLDPGFVIKEEWTGALNRCALSLDLGAVTLKAGDHIHINMILMPWGSQYSKDDSNVSRVRVDSCLFPLRTTVTTGTLIPDNYMPKIMADHDTAEFTLKDGGGRMAVRVYGLTGWGAPQMEELVDGEWVPYVTNFYDYDGYMVYYENDGTYSVSFIVETEQDTERTFRIVGN